VGNVCWWNVHNSAKVFNSLGCSIHIVDTNVSDPTWLSADFPRVLVQVHHPAYRDLASGKQSIGPARDRHVYRTPTHDLGIEGRCGLQLCRNQFVPGETAMRVDHVFSHFSLQREASAPPFEPT